MSFKLAKRLIAMEPSAVKGFVELAALGRSKKDIINLGQGMYIYTYRLVYHIHIYL